MEDGFWCSIHPICYLPRVHAPNSHYKRGIRGGSLEKRTIRSGTAGDERDWRGVAGGRMGCSGSVRDGWTVKKGQSEGQSDGGVNESGYMTDVRILLGHVGGQ
ncbi:hypothetical protein ACFXTN_043147 [Malus domestica]